MFRQALSLLLLASSASAFVTSPFGGYRALSQKVVQSQLLSEPNGATEPVAEPVVEVAESVAEPAVAEIASEGITEESADASDEIKTPKAPQKDDKDRITAFVGNLPFTMTSNELRDLFAEHGEVLYVSLPVHKESGQARGFAFVDMISKEALETAIGALNGFDVGGRMIRVVESLPQDKAKVEPKKFDQGIKKLYVGNIPFECSIDHLKEYFGEFGTVQDVYIPLNPGGKPRGFAFVSMTEEDIDGALESTNGQEFMGRTLTVSLPLPPGEKAPRTQSRMEIDDQRKKLYIGNLSFYTSPDTLAELFEEFGTVHDCYLPEDPVTGSARGFGFVTMDKDAADRAIEEIDGCDLDGRIIRVNEAMPKGAKPAKETYDDEE